MAANNSTNNILKQILLELDGIKGAQKSSDKKEESNAPKSSIGNINVSNAKSLNEALGGLAGSMQLLKKVSKNDVDNVVKMIDVIGASFSKIKIKKEDITGFGEAISAFGKMHEMMDKVSGSFLKMVIKFNPMKGKLAGWTLGGFYQGFLKGFEKRLSITTMAKKFGGKNLGANLTGFSTLMQTMLSFDWKQLLKVGLAWKLFPSSAGKNIAAFMLPIIEVIKLMPKALANKKTSVGMFGTKSSETTYVTNPQISGFIEVMQALTAITPKQVRALAKMGKKLDGKKGRNIAKFFGSFVKEITKHGEKKAHEAARVVNSLTAMFIGLTASLILITATVAIAGWENTLIGLGILTFMVVGSMFLIKHLSKRTVKKGSKDSLYTTLNLVMLFTSLTVNLMLLTSLVKNNKPEHIFGGLLLLTALTLSSLWLIKKLGSRKMQKNAKDALKTTSAILLLMGGMTAVALLSIIIGKNVIDVAIGLTVVIALAVVGFVMLKKFGKMKATQLKQGLQGVAVITLMMVGMAVVALIAVAVGKNGLESLFGALIIVGLAFAGLAVLKKLSKIQPQKLKWSLVAALGISAFYFIIAFTIYNFIVPAMKEIDKIGWKGILVGLGIMAAMIVGGIFMIKRLAKLTKKQLISGTVGAAAIAIVFLILSWTLNKQMAPAMKAIDKIGWKGIISGVGILAAMVIGGIVMVKRLSKLTKKQLISGTVGAGAIAIVFYIMCKALNKYLVPAMKSIDKIGYKGIIAGISILTAMAGGGIAMIKILSKMSKAKLKKGSIAAGIVAGVILILCKGMQLFGQFLESIHKVSGKDIAIGSAIMVGMVTAVGAACFAAGALVMGPQAALFLAGAGAMATISGVILAMSAALLAFTKMVSTVNKSLTVASMRQAKNIITGKGGMVDCIKDIVKGLSSIGLWASVKIGIISRNLNPLFTGLSKFCDVIQKMSLMKMLEGYDAKGKPIYKPLKPEDFTKAAVNLSVSFATFLKLLNGAFVSGPNAAKMYVVIKALTKGGVVELMKGLSLFVDAVMKLATMQIPVQWDKNGRPVQYKHLKPSAFKKAAINIAKGFASFLKILNNSFVEGPGAARMYIVLKALTKGGIVELMTAISSFTNTVLKLATMQVADKWDKNGNPIHYKKLKMSDFSTAATTIATVFSTFLKTLNKQLASQALLINWTVNNLVGSKGKNGLKALMDAINAAIDPIVVFSSGKKVINKKEYKTDLTTLMQGAMAFALPISYVLKTINGVYKKINKRRIKYVCSCIDIINKTMSGVKNFVENANSLVKGSDTLFKWLNTTALDANKAKIYADSMERLGKSLKYNKYIFGNASRKIYNLARAIKKLDVELIKRSNERIKAINLMTESFSHLNDQIGELNKQLNKSMQFATQFNNMKDTDSKNFIVNAVSYVGKITQDVGEKVEKIHKSNEKAEAKKQERTENTAINTDAIALAIIDGLNKWNAEHKDLTLELSGKGAVALGTIYGNK